MNSPDDKAKEFERRERELKEREQMIRLREIESELYQPASTPVYSTTKHQPPEKTAKRWKKLANIGKFFLLVVAVIVGMKVASWLAGAIIVGSIAFVGYKLFLEGDRK
ncbi:hypothetical protein H6G20_01635 [Desertifilum sp. FACHB-1129]|uniref:DUF3040 domain-containing protein n=3 Tax=Cyanophyceae TaxID=3028117 RepID=A0A1E5QFI7_9CYAN|nr:MULTISPECIES: hypothetical protein [Cyanophyceae]MCD8485995.1 hypothetical protein [Desertifilum sp.]MDA0208900.1 hypothetical protein [Cyanobacteria bacterium FC1]MDI9637107.1 hypothetical protein [Geitlerinema splendidum]MDK3159709.1 hypothetical protein [Kamptonema cortianum]NES94966.1 hypothetical protein [Desertifilum sp. SIO1I2]